MRAPVEVNNFGHRGQDRKQMKKLQSTDGSTDAVLLGRNGIVTNVCVLEGLLTAVTITG